MSSSSLPCMNPSRSELRRRRRALALRERRALAVAAASRAATLPVFIRAKRIAFYLASDGELDPLPLIRHAAVMHKCLYLPVLHPLGHRRLWFARWQPGEPLRRNLYGISEPLWEQGGLIDPRALDLVFMPLVAFDARCNRMGMGAGYYDRTFAWKLRRRFWKGPKLVGYAYSLQKLPGIEARPWDVPMNMVVTENEIYRCDGS